jgi:hypothetical protein
MICFVLVAGFLWEIRMVALLVGEKNTSPAGKEVPIVIGLFFMFFGSVLLFGSRYF